jgi:hypothetical protein
MSEQPFSSSFPTVLGFAKHWWRLPGRIGSIYETLCDLRELLVLDGVMLRYAQSSNVVAKCGGKCFSQSDEDGVTLEIVRRLGMSARGTFAELGVGNGLENNTLVLRALGWNGYWIGGETLAVDPPGESSGFLFQREWITRENVLPLCLEAQRRLGIEELDVMSVDLDGNDYYLVEQLLRSGVSPRVLIVEYNGKFVPPIEWVVPYMAGRVWTGGDWFGASLASWVNLLNGFGYRLVCCNLATGVNAFFVRRSVEVDFAFADVSESILDGFVAPHYHLLRKHGHQPTSRLVQSLLARSGDRNPPRDP